MHNHTIGPEHHSTKTQTFLTDTMAFPEALSTPNGRQLDAGTARRFFSFYQQILRLSLTILCVVFLLASLKIYQDKGNLTSTEVNTFNAISSCLALLIGLSFFVRLIQSLKALLF